MTISTFKYVKLGNTRVPKPFRPAALDIGPFSWLVLFFQAALFRFVRERYEHDSKQT